MAIKAVETSSVTAPRVVEANGQDGRHMLDDAQSRLHEAARAINLEPWIERVLGAMQMEYITEFPVRMDSGCLLYTSRCV